MIVFAISFVRALCLQGLSGVGKDFHFDLSGRLNVREFSVSRLYRTRISSNPYISIQFSPSSSFDGNSCVAHPRKTKLHAIKAIAPC